MSDILGFIFCVFIKFGVLKNYTIILYIFYKIYLIIWRGFNCEAFEFYDYSFNEFWEEKRGNSL